MNRPNAFARVAVLGAVAGLVSGLAGAGEVNTAGIAAVKSGTVKEAKASWWGFDPEDSTEALQNAIDSGVPKLVVDNLGKPWIVRPIQLASNQEVVFEEGVVVQAKKGEFKNGNDCLFTAAIKENVTLRGYGATLRMNRSDYDGPEYKRAEWRHVLSIRSSSHVKVYGLTLAESGGDGIYLGVLQRGVPNADVHIKDVVCDRNYRQGISVISARNLLIENTVMKDTGGTAPKAGIDFEPNGPSEEIVNCVMRNCVSENNVGCGYVFHLPSLRADSAPLSVRLENCIARGPNSSGFQLVTGNEPEKTVGGTVEVVNCRFEGSRGPGIAINRKPAAGARVTFENCVVDRVAVGQPAITPVLLASGVGDERPVGGVDFGKLTVIDPVKRPFLRYDDWSGTMAPVDVAGTFVVRRNGEEQETQITPEWLKKEFPLRVRKQIAKFGTENVRFVPAGQWSGGTEAVELRPMYLRKSGTLAIYAKQGEEVSLTIDHAQVGRYGGKPIMIAATSPSGKAIPVGAVPFQEQATLSFRAPETGLYRLPCSAGANRFALLACTHPALFSGEERAVGFISAFGDVHFYVPPGTKEFGVMVYGQGAGEAVKATIHDPSGKNVWSHDNITLPRLFDHVPTAEQQGSAWRLQLARPSGTTCEDFSVDLRGIPPFLSTRPDMLIKPAE